MQMSSGGSVLDCWSWYLLGSSGNLKKCNLMTYEIFFFLVFGIVQINLCFLYGIDSYFPTFCPSRVCITLRRAPTEPSSETAESMTNINL